MLYETLESIYWKYRGWKPEKGRKFDLGFDRKSIVFPKYSIVDCTEMPKLWGDERVYRKFVSDWAERFIVFINFRKKKAFPGCGGNGHVLFSSCYKD